MAKARPNIDLAVPVVSIVSECSRNSNHLQHGVVPLQFGLVAHGRQLRIVIRVSIRHVDDDTCISEQKEEKNNKRKEDCQTGNDSK